MELAAHSWTTDWRAPGPKGEDRIAMKPSQIEVNSARILLSGIARGPEILDAGLV